MYSLFSTPPPPLGGQLVISRFRDVARKTYEDVEKVIEYFRAPTNTVGSDHILVRLIMTMAIPITYELDRYYDIAMARALSVASLLHMSSSLSRGQWHKGRFYKGSYELLIAYTDEHRPGELAKGWQDLEAVYVMDCPISNMGYLLPNGKPGNDEVGFASIGIDIPMLMVQYRSFMRRQLALQTEDPTMPKLGVTHFVAQYVIPNMLRSQTDSVLFNRLEHMYYGTEMGTALKRHPFYLSDYTALLDVGLSEVLERIKGSKMQYRDMLEQIPKVYTDYPYGMPDILETKQVYWALFLSRLKHMVFLFDIGQETGRHYNQALLNKLKIDLKRFKSDNIFSSVLPLEVQPAIESSLTYLQDSL